ncbi:hypothetical protein [Parageobacillus thermoglucosidasius]|uniref:hypothetical protein n=1 Tax=Parageobacillus thermoglucosidasius TaxID=1426 RepID=UPI0027F3E17D|nr:hypothetical protein PthstB1num2_00110 [Parageobacillus thermoglucosidasius]
MSWLGIAKLEEMEMMARGNPEKIAKYKREKDVYDTMVKTYFNDEVPFLDYPSESYVKQLEQKAAETGDEADIIRAAMMRDRFEYNEYKRRQEHFDNVKTRQELRRKLNEGATLTRSDLLLAEKLARKFPSPDNLVMYSKIKRIVEASV